MALVWQSSIFWLMICAALLVLVGCTLHTLRTPTTHTAMPSNTRSMPDLLPSTYSPPDFFYLPLTNQRMFLTPTPWLTSGVAPPGPLPDDIRQSGTSEHAQVRLDTPTCYQATQATIGCIGKAWNEGESVTGSVALRLEIESASNTEAQISEIITTQRRIEPQQFAPYHAIFSVETIANIRDETDTTINISALDISTYIETLFSSPDNSITLTIVESRGELTSNGRYHLATTIRNDATDTAENIRLIVSLTSIEWGIVGYRVHEVEGNLRNRAEQLIQMDIIPYVLADDLIHHIHAEADIIAPE